MSNIMKKLTFFAVVVASAIFLFSCEKKKTEILIGIGGPHTGANAAFGEQLWKGSEQAANDINEAGGINGVKVRVIKADDACEPKQAVSVANKMVDQDKVDAIVGHFCSSSTIPATEIYSKANIVSITPASTNPQVTERGLPTVFRTCGRDDQQGEVAGDFIVNKMNLKKIAVIHDQDTYGKGLADATKAKLESLGAEIVLYEGLTRGEKDFNALVSKIKTSEAEAAYFGGLHTEGGILVRQMREQGLEIPFISGDGIVSEEFFNTSGGKTENVYHTFSPDPLLIPEGKAVVDKFNAAGYKPEGYTLLSYAAMQILAEGIKNSLKDNKIDNVALRDYIHGNQFSTVLGDISYDEKGDPSGKWAGYVVYKWEGNTYKMLDN